MKYLNRFLIFVLMIVVLNNLAFSASVKITQKHTIIELAVLLKDRDPNTRCVASAALRRYGVQAKPVLRQLISSLQDSNSQVVEDIVWTLGFIGPDAKDAIPYLTDMITQLGHPSRVSAAVALGLIGSPAASTTSVLIAALHDNDPELRSAAALTLGSIGQNSDLTASALIQLTKDKNEQVRHNAVISLGRLGCRAKSAIPVLKDLATDWNPFIKRDSKLACSYIEQSCKNSDGNISSNQMINNKQDDATSTQIFTPVKIISRQKPKYTEIAARHKISGDVTLSVLFKANGTIGDVKIVKGLGFGLDESAIEATYKLKFVPAEQNGKPIDMYNKVQYSFVQIN